MNAIARLFLPVAALFAMTACVVVDTTTRTRADVTTRDVVEQNFVLDSRATAGIGEAMVRVRDYTERTTSGEVMTPNKAFTIESNGERHEFAADAKFLIEGVRRYQKLDYTVIAAGRIGGSLQIAPDGSIVPTAVDRYLETEWPITVTPTDVRFSRTMTSNAIPTLKGLNYDLVFAGIDGSAMRFQVREYGGTSLTSPRVSQDISFPLGTSQIQYKTLKVDVVSVTPTQITFIVRQALMPDVMLAPPSPVPLPPAPPKANRI